MKVRFQSLQDSLRAAIWARLERGELTGKSLARKAAFQQAHLSNFLNGKRGLSLQATDRLLDVLHLDVLQLAGIDGAADIAAHTERHGGDVEHVAVVTLEAAAHQARFGADDIQDVVAFPRSFLRRLKPHMIGNRRDWTRFVVVRIDAASAAGMAPLLRPGAQVLIDRHYNAPQPQREPSSSEVYAVNDGPRGVISRLSVAPGNLIVRPLRETERSPVHLIPVPEGRRAADFIIGRLRHIAMEI